MDRQAIFEQVRDTILQTNPDLDPSEIDAACSFQTLGLDSLRVVELGVRVEQVFGDRVVLDDWVDEESLRGADGYTMRSLLDFVERSLA